MEDAGLGIKGAAALKNTSVQQPLFFGQNAEMRNIHIRCIAFIIGSCIIKIIRNIRRQMKMLNRILLLLQSARKGGREV